MIQFTLYLKLYMVMILSCVYSDYNSDDLIFRIRLKNIMKKRQNQLDQFDEIYILKNFQENEL